MRAAGLVVAVGSLLLCCAGSPLPGGSPVLAPPWALASGRGGGPSVPDADASLAPAGDSGEEAATLGSIDEAADARASDDAGGLDAHIARIADDPMALHHEDSASLRALMGAAGTLPFAIGGGAWRIGQGNRAVSEHAIGRRACLEGLRGVELQTPEQLARCGAPNMVPVWSGGRAGGARFCIDVFEFPNRACELPFVFVSPSQASRICEAQGKRLCAQEEWSLSCRADPSGGPDRTYAYGDDLDLRVCNTNKSRGKDPLCNVSTEDKVWTTCGTDTEPSGSFPGCRSRFGVYDQHGNVAEIMTRYEPADGEVKSQLKGSAFFYVDVAKKPTDPGGYWKRYPDDCNFDPRWHVEKLETAAHVNYHLGFRCCKSLGMRDAGAPAPPDAALE